MNNFRRRLLSTLGFNPDKFTVDLVASTTSTPINKYYAVKYDGRLLEVDEFDVSVSSSEIISSHTSGQNRFCSYYKRKGTYYDHEYNVYKYYNWDSRPQFYIYYQGHICEVNSSDGEILEWL